jgi:hypothetical protein
MGVNSAFKGLNFSLALFRLSNFCFHVINRVIKRKFLRNWRHTWQPNCDPRILCHSQSEKNFRVLVRLQDRRLQYGNSILYREYDFCFLLRFQTNRISRKYSHWINNRDCIWWDIVLGTWWWTVASVYRVPLRKVLLQIPVCDFKAW